jgi:hypothetical protein
MLMVLAPHRRKSEMAKARPAADRGDSAPEPEAESA